MMNETELPFTVEPTAPTSNVSLRLAKLFALSEVAGQVEILRLMAYQIAQKANLADIPSAADSLSEVADKLYAIEAKILSSVSRSQQ